MSLSKEGKPNIFERTLSRYLQLLQERPLITKSCTSAVVSGFGNFLSQIIAPHPDGKIVLRSILSYSAFAFCVSAPVIHHFYLILEKYSRSKEKRTQVDAIIRLLIDRFIFTPPFVLLFLYVVPILEGQGPAAAVQRIKESFWMILKMNWKVWTIFTYINVNYIPVRYRVLFGNCVGLFWSIYIAIKRRQLAK